MKLVGLTMAAFFSCWQITSAAEPFAKAAIENRDGIVAGQQVYLAVDIYAPNFMTSPPQLPLFSLPNGLVTLPDERVQNLLTTVDGQQYAGIRRHYVIVPEVVGDYTVPPIEIPLGYSVNGATVRGHVITSTVSFSVVGDRATSANFAASNLTIEQTFDRDPKSLKVGDALVRKVTITAENTQSMLIPSVASDPIAGLRQYVKPAFTQDDVGRDGASRRTETFVYTMEQQGNLTLPRIDYPWFDVQQRELRHAELPAVDIAVAPGPARSGIHPDPAGDAATNPFEHRRRVALFLLLLVATVTGAWMARRLPRVVVQRLKITLAWLRTSRWYRFQCLHQSVMSASPEAAYQALQQWSRAEDFRTLHDWLAKVGPELAEPINGLERMLFSDKDGRFDRPHIARLLRSAYSTRRAKVKQDQSLPDLNPGRPDTDV